MFSRLSCMNCNPSEGADGAAGEAEPVAVVLADFAGLVDAANASFDFCAATFIFGPRLAAGTAAVVVAAGARSARVMRLIVSDPFISKTTDRVSAFGTNRTSA